MEFFLSAVRYVKEHLLLNPLVWGIAAVLVWIAGSAFIKAWRGKNGDDDDQA